MERDIGNFRIGLVCIHYTVLLNPVDFIASPLKRRQYGFMPKL
jgi:hypothetical protein